MKAAASDNRNTMAADTSASVPKRCNGHLSFKWRICACTSGE
jgi:hypothetical protein